MGEFCQNCKKEMKHPELTHCSDECLYDEMKIDKTVDDFMSLPVDVDNDWDSKPWI